MQMNETPPTVKWPTAVGGGGGKRAGRMDTSRGRVGATVAQLRRAVRFVEEFSIKDAKRSRNECCLEQN